MDLKLNQIDLDLIFKYMDDSVCITTKKGELTYLNDSAKALFDLTEFTDEKIWKLIPYVETNDDLIQLFIDATTAKEKTQQKIVEYEKNDGSVCRLRVNITYTLSEDFDYFIIVITNLTELFRLNSAFERYTSREIADYVLNTSEGEKQGGKVKDVTILMSDIRGFTALSTRLDPDTLITILNHYFEKVVAVISRYHGTVIEFLGDGIFVVFGAPKDNPSHASDAVACAVEMENAMIDVNEWNKEHGYPELQMGIGINSGKCVVGNIGSDQKMKYGCMGETVNLAGRVESFTAGGQVYISENTKALLSEELTITEEQKFMPKGAKKEISIYCIESIGDVHLINSAESYEWSGSFADHEIVFFDLDGKAVGSEGHKGVIYDISKDERFAMLRTDAPIKKLMNIMIDIGADLYAKVMGQENDGWVICFTSKPDSFEEWKK